MNEVQQRFLVLLWQLPARLTTEQVAWVLNCQPHDVPVLAETRLLKPLDNGPPKTVKYFAPAAPGASGQKQLRCFRFGIEPKNIFPLTLQQELDGLAQILETCLLGFTLTFGSRRFEAGCPETTLLRLLPEKVVKRYFAQKRARWRTLAHFCALWSPLDSDPNESGEYPVLLSCHEKPEIRSQRLEVGTTGLQHAELTKHH